MELDSDSDDEDDDETVTVGGCALQYFRCVFADNWFASVSTVLALREHLGLHFTGPIKTAHKNFPLDPIRHTLAKLNRGDHITLKCVDVDNLWALGWHDHHFKCCAM